MTPKQFAEFLSNRLRDVSRLPRPRMSPQLAYGRHRGPVPVGTRLAAVAVALYLDPRSGWTVPLTLRPSTLQHHAGQICLPGGQIEPDEDPLTAAMREFEEELGIRPVLRSHCGELSPQYVYASRNLVHPVVAIVEAPDREWSPDPVEVQQVITMPLSILGDARHRRELVRRRAVRVSGQEVDQLVYRAAAIELNDQLVWGATALILDQLAQILHPEPDAPVNPVTVSR
jgi:8-oxo-dGTP pyrophosphatase MutT (NUDIX family)